MQMFMSMQVKKRLSLILLPTFVWMTSLSAHVSAAMVSTESKIELTQQSLQRDQLLQLVQQQEARAALERFGVAPEHVEKRIASMTADELAQFNHQLESLPAGGNGIIGVVLFIFVMLVVLDLLGATNIFPVIKPIGSNK